MRTVEPTSLDALPALPRGGVATLGVFDGVHLGHRQILERVVARARAAAAPAVVLTFAVHPVVVVRGLPPRLITSLPHRLRLFAAAGIDLCVVLPFDRAVQETEAEAFATRVFVDLLGARALVLGPDARVGKDRRGDLTFLRDFCARHAIDLEVVPDLRLDGARVSSTRVRAAIADGDLERARRLLGRDFSILGTVVAGDGRGRQLGFRTANLDLHHEIRPPLGVYAARVRLDDARTLDAVVNVGVRPTFGPDGDLLVEAHLLDHEEDLYGRDLEVVLVTRIRDEMRFPDREALVRRIREDVAAARRALHPGR